MSKPKHPSIEQINDIIRTKFGLNPVGDVVNIEIVLREQDSERYDQLRAAFEEQLADHPNREAVERRSYFGEAFAVHLQSWFATKEVGDVPTQLLVHYPICTVDEIRRIQSPACAADYLLLLRADAIADSARLKRVFMKRREKYPESWSLTAYFDKTPFERYLLALPDDQKVKCQSVPAGMAFLREPNGACLRSPLGDVIVISEALQHYLYYMNVFLIAQDDISKDDCVAALMIALRTMFLTESLDFDLDPRGPLPEQIDQNIAAMVEDQLQFVVGHEYAHLILDHLDLNSAIEPPLGVIPIDISDRSIRYYTPRQQQEFAADTGALLHARLSDQELAKRLNSATWFFLGLDIFYAVAGYVNPAVHAPTTHPDPIDRIWRLRKETLGARTLDADSIYSDEEIANGILTIRDLKSSLLKHFIPYQIDALETYGSVYLPSYKGPQLHDRLDF